MKDYSKYLFLLSFFPLLSSGFFIMLGHNGFASHLLNLTFWISVAGVIFYIWEAKKHEA